MKRMLAALLIFGLPAVAQIAPEECVVKKGEIAAASATFNGKTYTFSKVECRDLFLSDPERYAQLYDALAEMLAAGAQLEAAPRDASLVPS